MTPMTCLLVLETGEVYEGWGWGHASESIGEVVFNTSMTGYQEILTDPSYAGQLVVMTYPHIGNCGVNAADVESGTVQPAGLIVRELSRRPSNYRSNETLDSYLERHQVAGISGIDTRALTRRIRSGGAVMGLLAPGATKRDLADLLTRLKAAPHYSDRNYITDVSVQVPQRVTAVSSDPCVDVADPLALVFQPLTDSAGPIPRNVAGPKSDGQVVVVDFGVKYSILRHILGRGFDVTLVPCGTSASELLALSPNAILLSNGPGDPALLDGPVAMIKALLGSTTAGPEVPIYGICLGHQLLARAFGASTFKLKFGHRGANQPVLDHRTGRVTITSQNHGYAVDPGTLSDRVEVTQTNLNDGTVEGMRHREWPIMSVQYHPEAGPGPNDGAGNFDDLAELVRRHRSRDE